MRKKISYKFPTRKRNVNKKKKKRFQKIRLLKDKKEKKSKVCRSYQNIKALIHLQNSA